MTRLLRKSVITAIGLGLLVAATMAGPMTVAAKSGDVIRTGSCTGSSDWKLKVHPDNGRLEVEFEVDQNVNNQTWNVKLRHNRNVFWSGHKVTTAPSGSFSVSRRTSNAAGADRLVGRAINPKTGEICRGVVVI